jgi:thymidylate kinase
MIEGNLDMLIERLEQMERKAITLREKRYGPLGVRPSVAIESERLTIQEKMRLAIYTASAIHHHLESLDE